MNTDANYTIKFTLKGNAELIGNNPVNGETGVATILLKTGKSLGTITISAASENLKTGIVKIVPALAN